MNSWQRAVHLAAIACVGTLVACDKQTAPPPSQPVASTPNLPTAAQPKLPTMKLWLGAEEMNAELALNFTQQLTGMMFRTNMDQSAGMLFPLPSTQRASFWMKNCPLPLSVAYISPDGVIQEIHDLQPQNTNNVTSASANIRFALETSQGWFSRHNIKPGTIVRTEHGSLMDTFFKNR